MKYILVQLFLLISVLVCGQDKFSLYNFPEDKVMVVAHRGNWREAPENSVWAVKKAIEYGADMAEIDVALTKDSVVILMHDRTIDRTTTGKGMPSDYTLDEIRQFYLRDGGGAATRMQVPTLREILEVSKGEIFLNIDKGFNYIELIYPMLIEYDMVEEVLFKGGSDYSTFNAKYGYLKDDIVFMPIINLQRVGKAGAMKIINGYLDNYTPYGFEFTTGLSEEHLIDFSYLRDRGMRVWINSLWPDHNAGNHDDLALENPDVYDWYIRHHVNIIQTDRIKELTDYLKRKDLKHGYKKMNLWRFLFGD